MTSTDSTRVHLRGAAVVAAALMLAALAVAASAAGQPEAARPATDWSGCTAGGAPVTDPPLFGNTGDGFLANRGAFTRIAARGASETVLYGINNRGQIVGGYADAEGRGQGFLLDKGVSP
jgi:hypothetical protein